MLVRALEPSRGLEAMRTRRGEEDVRRLCSGPGRLCQALAVTSAHDGLPIDTPPFDLSLSAQAPDLVAGPRIGVSKAVSRPWRFGLRGSPFLSRPFPIEAPPN